MTDNTQISSMPTGTRQTVTDELTDYLTEQNPVIKDQAMSGMVMHENDRPTCSYCGDVGSCMYCKRGQSFKH